jgi:hypothetical protein
MYHYPLLHGICIGGAPRKGELHIWEGCFLLASTFEKGGRSLAARRGFFCCPGDPLQYRGYGGFGGKVRGRSLHLFAFSVLFTPERMKATVTRYEA